MINFNFVKRKIFFLSVVPLFFFSRFFISGVFGIEINGANFGYHTLHFDLLQNDLIQSVLYQHSQPPLWSLYVGSLIKITNGDYDLINFLFLFINSLFSLGIVYYALLIAKFFNFSINQSFILLIILILNPSIIFYENLFSYHQLTAFLFTQACYLVFMFVDTKKTRYEILLYLNLAFIGFVWAAFQPLLIIVIFIVIRTIVKKKFTKNLFIFVVIILISFFPHIKNKIIFGSFTSSSWSGHNFSTVFNPEWLNFCGHPLEKQSFYKDEYEKKFNKSFNHPSLVGDKALFNNIGLVYKSDKCFSLTLQKIINEPKNYFATRVTAILASHGKFAFDFTPKPKGWKINFYDNFLEKSTNKFYRQIILLFLNLIIYLTLLYMIFFSNYGHKLKYSLLIIAALYSYLAIISYAFVCCEQERTLYTGYIKEILFLIFLIQVKNKKTILD